VRWEWPPDALSGFQDVLASGAPSAEEGDVAKKRFILSIEGGGVRGIIPALVLAELETRLGNAGKSTTLADHFDMIAGTSTGGIIAAGLTCPKPKPKNSKMPACSASDLVSFYENESAEIFDQSFFAKLRRDLTNPGGLLDQRYDAAPLEAKLKSRLGTRTVAEALKTVVLTAYDITRREAVFITNGPHRDGSPSDDYLFWEAARATSAAPTYFEPALITNLTQKRSDALIDGGVFANDPSLAAVVEGKKQGWSEDDMVILSVSTGEHNRPFAYADVRNWGALSWISPAKGSPILSIVAQGQASTVSYQMNSLFRGAPSYFRVAGKLENASDDLDDASPENIRNLRLDAQNFIGAASADLDTLVAMM
jgi:patatin-like phospholipase/acyl hydrolase